MTQPAGTRTLERSVALCARDDTEGDTNERVRVRVREVFGTGLRVLLGLQVAIVRRMDHRQVEWVRASIADEVGDVLTDEQLDRVAHVAVKQTITWMIGAAQEGMLPPAPKETRDG